MEAVVRWWRFFAGALESIGVAEVAEMARNARAQTRLRAARLGVESARARQWPEPKVPWPQSWVPPKSVPFMPLLGLWPSTFLFRNSSAQDKHFEQKDTILALDVEARQQRIAWFHAASVGEGLCIVNLVEKLLREKLTAHVVMTCSSASALAVVPDRFSKDFATRITFGLAPLDFPRRVDSFLDAWQPSLAVWVESELWPCTLHELKARKVPLFLVNGRLSERSLRRWQMFTWTQSLLASMLSCFDYIAARSDQDSSRIEVALKSSRAEKHVNAVIDFKSLDFLFRRSKESDNYSCMDTVENNPVARIFESIDNARHRTWVAGSTHKGEEVEVAKAHLMLSKAKRAPNVLDNLKDKDQRPLTIIAPRHPERCTQVLQNVAKVTPGVIVLLWSELINKSSQDLRDCTQESCIIIIDSLGILAQVYEQVDIAFIGGSLPQSEFKGVHNANEALFAGCSLVMQGVGAAAFEPLVPGVHSVCGHEDIVQKILSARTLEQAGCGESASRHQIDQWNSLWDNLCKGL
mmetsp:Transcript_22793/g.44798  ORF Transcript_22793/g.44798 Transcript_22793/m.44798 type:complete len:522 (+) Transcript_22793:70-1635(+)